MINKLTLPQAIAFVSDTTNTDDVQHTTNLLESSKSTDGTYRPYYVCAIIFWLKPSNNLIKGENAQFDQNTTVTFRYLRIQQSIDLALKLQIEPNFSCESLIATIQSVQAPDTTRSNSVGFLAIDF